MITVNKLSVTSLSAISANIGNVTAGSITGVNISGSNIYAGNVVTLDGNGIAVAVGDNFANMYKFSNNLGMGTYNNGSGLSLSSGGGLLVSLNSGGAWVLNPSAIYKNIGGGDIGQPGARLSNIYTSGLNLAADSQNAGIGRPLVVAGDGVVHGVGNSITGTWNGFTFENGICIGHP